MTSISIALATYNGDKFLEEQLNSLNSQSCQPDQLIVCDDGSIDKTVEILDEFAKHATFEVSIHRNPSRLGYRKNFVKAACLCSSDLIAFCDQDDIWEEDKLRRCKLALAAPEILLCYHALSL